VRNSAGALRARRGHGGARPSRSLPPQRKQAPLNYYGVDLVEHFGVEE